MTAIDRLLEIESRFAGAVAKINVDPVVKTKNH